MADLADFERDLHRHVQLENDILFPKAVALHNHPACDMHSFIAVLMS
jgi:hypothetical protein